MTGKFFLSNESLLMFCQQIKTLFLPASQAKTVMVKDRTIQIFLHNIVHIIICVLKYSNQVHFLFCLRWYVLCSKAKVLCSSKRENVTSRCIRKTDNLNLACLILFYPDTMTVSVKMLGSHQLFYHTKKIGTEEITYSPNIWTQP